MHWYADPKCFADIYICQFSLKFDSCQTKLDYLIKVKRLGGFGRAKCELCPIIGEKSFYLCQHVERSSKRIL